MSGGPPFERYPGPPPADDLAFRVISPWRDALAWISIAGRLAVVRYLLRSDDGWRDCRPETPVAGNHEPTWEFVGRDPVELVFRTMTGVEVTATVTVARTSCDIRLVPAITEDEARTLVALPVSASVRESQEGTRIRIFPCR